MAKPIQYCKIKKIKNLKNLKKKKRKDCEAESKLQEKRTVKDY